MSPTFSSFSFALRIASLAVLCGIAVPLGAQDSAAVHRRDSTRADSARRLVPVTVTATRGAPRSLLETPLAATVVGREAWADRRGYGIDEALALVPGVIAQSRAGSSDVRLSIRGFGARGAGDRSNAGTSRGVRVLVDGMPETEPDGRTAFDNLDLASAERIDVVRSNAGALWGNAAGGVVNVTTVPDVTRPYALVQQQSGSFGFQRTVAQGATPVGPALLYGTFANTSFEGWRAQSSARRAMLSAGFVAPLGAPASGVPGDPAPTVVGLYLLASNNLFHIPGPLSAAQYDADPSQANATYQSRDERRHNRVARLGASLEHTRGAHRFAGALFVNPKYLQRSERGTYRDFTRHHLGGNATWEYARPIARTAHRFSVGVDAAQQDGAALFYSLTAEGKRGTTLRDNKAEGSRNTGLFAQDEIDLGRRLTLTLGARADEIAYDYRSYITPETDAEKRFRRVTPKVGLLARLGARHSLYASVGGGVEAPAGNETDPAGTFGQDTVTAINPLLEPITSTTYETGARGAWLLSGGPLLALTYDAAAYLTDVRNEIVPYRGGRFYFTAGRARRTGLELGGTAALRGGVSLRLAGTVSRNRYVDYVVDSVHYGRAGASADYSGNDIVGVPPRYYAAQLSWAPPALQRHAVEGRVGVQGSARYYADDANTVNVPGYTVANAGLHFEPFAARGAAARLRAFFAVENLFDRRYVSSAFLNPDVVDGAPLVFEPGLPRSVVVGVSVGRGR